MISMLTVLQTLFGAGEFPAPSPAPDTSAYGQHIQRSMRLMASSAPERKSTVRVLYYGQSITGRRWSEFTDADLKERFPNTHFIAKNLAIGGFSSERLVRTLHYDVLPFYPDLILFHVYGNHIEYENVIREIRSRTTAEIVIQTDHIAKPPEARAASVDEQETWDAKMNHWYLPQIADKYGCALQPQRAEWVQYLTDKGLEPADLLSDQIHLNAHGKWLMGEFMKRFLIVLPDDKGEQTVKTYLVGEDVRWEGNRLALEFEGNRVVAVARESSEGSTRVLVDGQPPSAFPECYTFTRPSRTPHIGWPCIQKMTWESPPVLEEWEITFTDFNEDMSDFAFEVVGSVTGPDGGGRGAEPFVSNSGRLVIEPRDWEFRHDFGVSKKPTEDGWKTTFRVEPMFVDAYDAPQVEDATVGVETTLVQGLSNGSHRLELVADGSRPAIEALRVYTPPIR